MGNTAEKLLNSAHCPILAVRPASKVPGRKKKK
jgi:nucleotide-binding universal stress UspA family protein